MSEAEQILTKVKQVKNVAVEGQVVERATRYMTHQEKESKKADLEFIEGVLSPANNLPNHVVLEQDARKNLLNYKRFLLKDLADNMAPENISGETKDALEARRKFLVEKIQEGMPPTEVMWRNPTGAVSGHLKWMDATKDYQLEYKNIRRVQEPDNYSEDLANIEMLRKSMTGPPGAASTFMADAQIPGVFAMSSLAKENWPLGEPKVDTPLAQAERRELEELRAKINDPKVQRAITTFEKMSVGAKNRWAKAREKQEREGKRALKKLQKENAEREAATEQATIEQQPEILIGRH